MKDFSLLADKTTVEEVIKNLKPRGIDAFFVQTGDQAKEKVKEIIPQGARVLASASVTLETTGIKDEIDESGNFVSVRKEYMGLDHQKDADKIRILRSTPDFIIASIHAITEQGEILIASNTGSQLAGDVAGAKKVIWVVGTQKIVKNLDEGFKRIYDYVLELENEHMQSLYKVNTNVSKLLIFSKEIIPGRVTIIFVNEKLGF